jgi:xanthine dehydrogenase accessory factor
VLPREDDSSAVLIVVVATQGSTYRKPGALLLRRESFAAGWLSGGCLEAELDLVAAEVLRDGRARVHAFNTNGDDDLLFGSASGCRGAITLLLLPVQGEHALVQALRALRQASTALELALRDDGSGDAVLGSQRWSWPASADSTQETTWSLRVAPPPRLLLCGVGPEAAPLLRHARELGWIVDAIEHRGRWRNHASAADVVVDAPPERAWSTLEPARYIAALVMGHHFGNDLVHLRELARSDIGYLGLLGPPARRDALLAEIGDALTPRLRERLHAPAGLRLGGEGPEPIALAIVADLQRHLAGLAA